MSHRCVVATFRFAVSMKCVQQSPMRGALLHFRPKITKNSLISPPWLAGYLCTNETIKNTSLIFSPGHHPLDELWTPAEGAGRPSGGRASAQGEAVTSAAGSPPKKKWICPHQSINTQPWLAALAPFSLQKKLEGAKRCSLIYSRRQMNSDQLDAMSPWNIHSSPWLPSHVLELSMSTQVSKYFYRIISHSNFFKKDLNTEIERLFTPKLSVRILFPQKKILGFFGFD